MRLPVATLAAPARCSACSRPPRCCSRRLTIGAGRARAARHGAAAWVAWAAAAWARWARPAAARRVSASRRRKARPRTRPRTRKRCVRSSRCPRSRNAADDPAVRAARLFSPARRLLPPAEPGSGAVLVQRRRPADQVLPSAGGAVRDPRGRCDPGQRPKRELPVASGGERRGASRIANRCNRRNGFAQRQHAAAARAHAAHHRHHLGPLPGRPARQRRARQHARLVRHENPYAPIDLFTRSQVPPQNGQNALNDSVAGQAGLGAHPVRFGLDVTFGRMPWSWGMGVVANHGNGYYKGYKSDIIRHLDRDYGDSVDSVRLAFDFGKDRRRTHTVAVSWDWAVERAHHRPAPGSGVGQRGHGRPDLLGREVRQRLPVERVARAPGPARDARAQAVAGQPGRQLRVHHLAALPGRRRAVGSPASATGSAPTQLLRRAPPDPAGATARQRRPRRVGTGSTLARRWCTGARSSSRRTCGFGSTGGPCGSSSRPPATSALHLRDIDADWTPPAATTSTT